MNCQLHIKRSNKRKNFCLRFSLPLLFAMLMLAGIAPVNINAQSDTSPYGNELADSSDTSSSGLKARFNAMAAQMLDNEAFASALRCSRLCKIGSWNIFGNPEQEALSDTLMYLRQARQCEVYFKCIVNYRSAYPKVLNKKKHQPTREDLETHFSELYKKELFIDLQLIPLWDTTKMRAEDAKTAKVPLWKIAFSSHTNHSQIDTTKINHIFRTHFAGKQFGSFQDKESENRPDKLIRKAMSEVVGELLDGADTISFDASIDHVTFTDAGGSKYGFDAWDEGSSAIKGQYETLQLNGKEYVIPYKSVAVNNTDKINAQAIPRVKDGAVTDSLEFSMASLKATIESQKNLKSYQLQLPSKTMEGSEQLSATFTLNDKTYDAGFVNVVGYRAKTFEVVLVPVENKTGKGTSSASGAQIKTALDSIYGQAAVSWTVSEDNPIKVPDIDLRNFNAGDNQLLSKYTDDMQLLVKTYKKERKNYDKNKYYVFLIPNSNKAGLYARMPLTSNFGFFFTKNLSVADKMAHTIAHELGHGAFHLYHTFSDKNEYTQSRGNTDNLMDYDNNLGTHLYKYQWDLVHDPESMLFAFMEDETESEAIGAKMEEFTAFQNEIDKGFSFINPAGKIVTIPARTEYVILSTYDRYFKEINGQSSETDSKVPIGCLINFFLDGEQYSARARDGQFYGYAYEDENNKKQFYKDSLSSKNNVSKGISIVPTVENNAFVGYIGQFKAPVDNTPDNFNGSGKKLVGLTVFPLSKDDMTKTVSEYVAAHCSFTRSTSKVSYIIKDEYEVISTNPSIKAGDYLRSNIDRQKKIIEVLIRFALVYRNSDALVAYEECEENAKLFAEILANLQIDMNQREYEYQYEYSLSDPTFYAYYDKSQEAIIKATKFNEAIESLFEIFNYVEGAQEVKKVASSAKSIEEIKTVLTKYYTNCTYKALDVNTRLNLLKWLFKSEDNDYWTINDVNVILSIIENAPDNHVVPILKAFMDNNYKYVKVLWDEGNRKKHTNPVIEALTPLLAKNYSALNIKATTKPVYYGFLTMDKKDVPVALTPVYYGLKSGNKYQLQYRSIYNSQLYPSNQYVKRGDYDDKLDFDFLESRKIEVSQEYTYMVPAGASYSNPGSTVNPYETYDRLNVKYEVNPFEYVTVYFIQDYPSANVYRGKAYYVPAIWLMNINREIKADQFKQYITSTAFDILNITLAVATMGSSAPLIAVINGLSAVVSMSNMAHGAINLAVGDDPYSKEWQSFYNSFMTVELALNAGNIVRAGLLKSSWTKFDNAMKTGHNNAPPHIVENWLRCKTLNSSDNILTVHKIATGQSVVDVSKANLVMAVGNVTEEASSLIRNTSQLLGDVPAGATSVKHYANISSIKVHGINFPVNGVKVFQLNGRTVMAIDGFCFDGKTTIHQPSGKKEIKDIVVGDKVLSFDHKTDKVVNNKVTKLFKRTTNSITKVFVAGSILLTTPEHPFFVNGSYIHAQELKSGDQLTDYSGNLQEVDSTSTIDTTLTVYNFEVEGAHNYYAGEQGVLVHNSCNLVKVAEKLNTSTSDIAKYYQRLNGLNLDAGLRSKFHQKLTQALGKDDIVKLLDDIGESDDLIKSFVRTPGLVDKWKVLSKTSLDDFFRKNVHKIDDVSRYSNRPGLGTKMNVTDYSNSAKNSVKDYMTPDHIPSFAAIKKSMEAKLGRALTADEARTIRNNSTTLLYETKTHQSFSRTYGGRNTVQQILEDSQDLKSAATKDMEALRPHLIESGISKTEIDRAFGIIHDMNKILGLY